MILNEETLSLFSRAFSNAFVKPINAALINSDLLSCF